MGGGISRLSDFWPDTFVATFLYFGVMLAELTIFQYVRDCARREYCYLITLGARASCYIRVLMYMICGSMVGGELAVSAVDGE